MANSTHKHTRLRRDAQLSQWILRHNPKFFRRRTSRDLATIASDLFGWEVSRARMCRALYAHNVLFRKVNGDPVNFRRSRMDYVVARLAKLEQRLNTLEVTVKKLARILED